MQDLEIGTSRTGDRQRGVHTSTPHAALGAEPLPRGDGLGSLPNAAHVVCCRTAVTAQQTATQTTQHAQIGVAIVLQLRRCCCCCCCLTPSAPPFFFAVILTVTIGLCEYKLCELAQQQPESCCPGLVCKSCWWFLPPGSVFYQTQR